MGQLAGPMAAEGQHVGAHQAFALFSTGEIRVDWGMWKAQKIYGSIIDDRVKAKLHRMSRGGRMDNVKLNFSF